MAGKYGFHSDCKSTEEETFPKIPARWSTRRVRFLLRDGADGIKIGPFGSALRLEDMVDAGVRVYGQENVIKKDFSLGKRQISKKKFFEMEVYETFPGDLLITMMGTSGKCVLVPYDVECGIIDSHLLRLRVNENKIHPEFFRLLIDESPEIKHQITVLGKGSIMHGLNSSIVKSLVLPLPSRGEQDQILNFLDHETAKIDTLIDKQQQLIKLLQEKRQAVISHAVTKGLNPDAPMKDSGVEWLGQVPEHWVVLSLGKITEDKCDGPFGSGLKSEHYTESGVLVVRLQNIKIGGYHEGEGAFIDEDYYKNNLSNHDVIAGDVLIAGLGDPNNPVGRACVAPENIAPAMVKADCFRFRLNRKKAISSFIAKQLSVSAWADAGRLSNGSTRARIPLNLMTSRKVAICPVDEQLQIVKHIERLSEQYDKMEHTVLRTVTLLQERRTALISAAVTGKIDVRNWQPSVDSYLRRYMDIFGDV